MQPTRTCSIADCGRAHSARGYCHPHYKRWLRWGDPTFGRDSIQSIDRFAEKVALTDDGCLVWLGTTVGGYGRFHIDSFVMAHRWAYEHLVGPIGDLHVLHRCDNPPCVNPEHLFLGTLVDNMQDKLAKGRAPRGNYSFCARGHEMTPENTKMRRQASGKYHMKVCIECRRMRDKLRASKRVG